MSGKRRNAHDRAADELLNDEDDVQEEGSEPEIEAAPEPIKDGDEIPVDPAPSRRERRQGRFEERILQSVEERLNSALERRLGSLEQRLQQPPQAPRQEQGPDQVEQQINARLQSVYDQQNALSATFRARQKDGNLTDAEYTEMANKARKLNEDAQELITIRASRKFGIGRQQDPQEAARQAIIAQNRAKHSDVYEHPDSEAMIRYADGYFQQRAAKAARLGQQVNGPELLEESLDKAREEWGIQPRNRRQQRSETERRKYTGAPTSGGSGGGGGQTVKLTKEIRSMADAAFPHIKDDAQRYAHWAKSAGKRLVSGE